MDSLIAQTQKLHQLTFGQTLAVGTDVEELLDRLEQGESDLICIVEWEPEIFHSLVLKSLRQQRVHFFNPQRPVSAPPGSILVANGPLRQVEEEGLESLSEDDFRQLFASGCCLLPEA